MNVAANRMPILESLNLKNSWILTPRSSISNIQTNAETSLCSGLAPASYSGDCYKDLIHHICIGLCLFYVINLLHMTFWNFTLLQSSYDFYLH